MPARKKKSTEAVASEAVPDVPEAAGGVEKKTRKANAWNLYCKAEYAKLKQQEEHKGKTHSQLTQLLKEEYKLKKEQKPDSAEPVAASSDQ